MQGSRLERQQPGDRAQQASTSPIRWPGDDQRLARLEVEADAGKQRLAAAPAAQSLAISRINSPRAVRSPRCNAQIYLSAVLLELLYEILYDRDNHASGRHGNRILRRNQRASAPAERTQGTDSGNDRTRTFALHATGVRSRSATDS